MNNHIRTSQINQDFKRLRFLKAAFLKSKTKEQKSKILQYLIKVLSKIRKVVSWVRLKPVLGSTLVSIFLMGPASVQAQKFSEPIKIEHGELLSALAPDLADIDGDGDLDIVHSLFDNAFFNGYFENIGTPNDFVIGGQFISIESLNDSTDVDRVITEMVDLDNDGDLDYTSIHFGENYEQLFHYKENLGNDAFAEIVTDTIGGDSRPLLFFAVDPNFIDIDNDGDLDLITTGYDVDAYYDSGVGQLGLMYVENIGTAESHAWGEASLEENFPFIAQEEEAPSSIELADFDLDGDIDIIISQYEDYDNYKYRVLYLENNGNGYSDPVELEFFDVQEGIALITAGDVDGDGDMDIVFNNFPAGYATLFAADLYWVENQNISNTSEQQLDTKIFSLATQLVTDNLQLNSSLDKTMTIETSVINSQGLILKKESIKLQLGDSTSEISLPDLSAGSYFLVINTESGVQTLGFSKI